LSSVWRKHSLRQISVGGSTQAEGKFGAASYPKKMLQSQLEHHFKKKRL